MLGYLLGWAVLDLLRPQISCSWSLEAPNSSPLWIDASQLGYLLHQEPAWFKEDIEATQSAKLWELHPLLPGDYTQTWCCLWAHWLSPVEWWQARLWWAGWGARWMEWLPLLRRDLCQTGCFPFNWLWGSGGYTASLLATRQFHVEH